LAEGTKQTRWARYWYRILYWVMLVPVWVIYGQAFPTGPAVTLGFGCIVLGSLICIFVHEAGHAAAAALVGWRVFVFAVRPVAFQIANRNVARMGRHDDEGIGGYVLAMPVNEELATRGRWAFFVMGGPIANLLLAPLCAAIWSWRHPQYLEALIVGLGLQSLHTLLFSILPHPRSLQSSDGQKLWQLCSRDIDWRGRTALGWVGSMGRQKVRLRDTPRWIDKHLVATMSQNGSLTPEEIETLPKSLEIGRILDSVPVDVARARTLLDAFRASYGPGEWQASCDAYLAAVWEGEGHAAAERLWQGAQSEDMEPLRLAAEAAVAARLGDADSAKAKLEAMDAALKRKSYFRDETYRDIRHQVESLIG